MFSFSGLFFCGGWCGTDFEAGLVQAHGCATGAAEDVGDFEGTAHGVWMVFHWARQFRQRSVDCCRAMERRSGEARLMMSLAMESGELGSSAKSSW